MISYLLGQDSNVDQSIKHILLVQDLGKNCIIVLHQYTYSVYKDESKNLIINEGIDQEAEAILLRIPLQNNHDYRFRIIAHNANLDNNQKPFIVNGQYCYWRNMTHGDLIQFGNGTSVQYYTIPDTLDIKTLQELLQLSNGENWYETCLNIFKSFSSSLSDLSQEQLEIGLNHIALLIDSSPELIIETTVDNELIYINSTALKQLPDLLDYGTSHPLLLGIEQLLQNNQVTFDTQQISVRNQIYLRTCQFNENTKTIRVFARYIEDSEGQSHQNRSQILSEIQQSYHYVTYLPGRALAETYLKEQLINNKNQNTVIFLLDLDGFKHINDTFGYFEGDRILKILSERLRSVLNQNQFLAHWGGDEFMIISSQADLKGVDQFSQKIIDIFKENVIIKKHETCVTTSMGISISSLNNNDIEPLIESAYIALRRAKTKGKQCYQFYQTDMATDSNVKLKTDLKDALEKDQLSVHYQPVINPQTGKIISLEALLRWQHPELGFIKPEIFIPLAEQTGLIGSLEEWLLETVCSQHNHWQTIGIPKIPISMNVSPKQLQQPNLRDKMSQIFKDTGFDSHYLMIEIEESTISDDLGYSPSIFWELSELGIKFLVDNFGSYNASFSHIQNFPFYNLKTDPSLIETILTEQSSLTILEAILAFSKSLKLQLIIKGVESKEQLGLLREHQFQGVQGNFIYSAMPAFQMTQVLQKCFQYSM